MIAISRRQPPTKHRALSSNAANLRSRYRELGGDETCAPHMHVSGAPKQAGRRRRRRLDEVCRRDEARAMRLPLSTLTAALVAGGLMLASSPAAAQSSSTPKGRMLDAGVALMGIGAAGVVAGLGMFLYLYATKPCDEPPISDCGPRENVFKAAIGTGVAGLAVGVTGIVLGGVAPSLTAR